MNAVGEYADNGTARTAAAAIGPNCVTVGSEIIRDVVGDEVIKVFGVEQS